MKKNLILLLVAMYFTSCSTFHSGSSRMPSSAAGEQVISHGRDLSRIDWRDLFYELNYINQYKMSRSQADFELMVKNADYYAPQGFNSAYSRIMTESKNTKEAFHKRESIMMPNESFFSRMSDYGQLRATRELGAGSLVDQIIASAADSQKDARAKLSESNNYMNTPVGKAAAEILRDYVIIVVPGFGSHSIKDYTWPEILRHMNSYYGRPLVRPSKKKADGTDTFMEMEEFYGKNASVGFDVVHPMGFELGYSMGSDVEAGQALAAWIARLKALPAYSNKKFVTIGYSKGTPISMNAFANHPEINGSIAAIITMGGVAQGAVPANSFVKKAYEKSKAVDRKNLVEDLTTRWKNLEQNINQAVLVSKNLLAANSTNEKYFNDAGDFLKAVMGAGGLNFNSNNVEDKINITDKRKAIEGVVDMSNYESVQWSLKNMNNQKFSKPVTLFNISMVTNVKDFVRPNAMMSEYLTPPLIVPQFTPQNSIVYSQLSKDDIFLYLTSVGGFEEAPGGLFDTQVAWLDTKSMAIDNRPLSHSLDATQMKMMQERLEKEGVQLPSGFENMPRRELLKQLAAKRGGMSNINFVDLGDFRGTHWDCAFEQVYKPIKPNQDYYKHQFPRRALQASVIEMLAIYKQLGGL